MKLTQQQIESLFQFTKKHYVEWYDLQVELVDHLASDIEVIMKENPHLNFDEARDFAFKKFGITGFYDVIAEKSTYLAKKSRKMLLKSIVEFFLSSKVLWFLLLNLLIVGSLYKTNYNKSLFYFYVIAFVGLIFGLYVRKHIRFHRKKKNNEKIWMIETQLGMHSYFIIMLIPQIINSMYKGYLDSAEGTQQNIWWFILFSIIVTLSLLIAYIEYFVLTKKIAEQVAEEQKKLQLH